MRCTKSGIEQYGVLLTESWQVPEELPVRPEGLSGFALSFRSIVRDRGDTIVWTKGQAWVDGRKLNKRPGRLLWQRGSLFRGTFTKRDCPCARRAEDVAREDDQNLLTRQFVQVAQQSVSTQFLARGRSRTSRPDTGEASRRCGSTRLGRRIVAQCLERFT